MPTFLASTELPVSAEEAFAWHLAPGAFERLVPPWDSTRVIERTGRIEDDTMRVVLSVPILGPLRGRWVVQHDSFVAGRSFRDVLVRGPFAQWEHTHLVEPLSESSSRLTDRIEYRLPLGTIGQLFGGWFVRRRLERTFAHRHAVTRQDLERQAGSDRRFDA